MDAQKNRLNEYPQYIFWMSTKENSFPIRTLIWRPDFTVSDPPYQTIDDTSADDFRKLVDLNLIGYYIVAKVFIKGIVYCYVVGNKTFS